MTAGFCRFCGVYKESLEWYSMFQASFCPGCIERRIQLTTLNLIHEIHWETG